MGNQKISEENGWVLTEILARAIKTTDPSAKFEVWVGRDGYCCQVHSHFAIIVSGWYFSIFVFQISIWEYNHRLLEMLSRLQTMLDEPPRPFSCPRIGAQCLQIYFVTPKSHRRAKS
jgi:hypothetical protein